MPCSATATWRAQIRDQGGHYFFEVKDNQEQLKRDIASAFKPAFSPTGTDAGKGKTTRPGPRGVTAGGSRFGPAGRRRG
jgi:hypothetical protein